MSFRKKEPGGQELIDTVLTLTGLPAEQISEEMETILASFGKDKQTLTLQELRDALAGYLETFQIDSVE